MRIEIWAFGGDMNESQPNGYACFYRGKRCEVYAKTTREAQLKAAEIFKAKKVYDVSVVLAEIDGKPINSTTEF